MKKNKTTVQNTYLTPFKNNMLKLTDRYFTNNKKYPVQLSLLIKKYHVDYSYESMHKALYKNAKYVRWIRENKEFKNDYGMYAYIFKVLEKDMRIEESKVISKQNLIKVALSNATEMNTINNLVIINKGKKDLSELVDL